MPLDGLGNRLMKYILVGFNIFVLIMGATTIGLGVWATSSEYGASEMKLVSGEELYHAACTIVLVGGSVMSLISLAGCLGGLLESKPVLGLYLFFMMIILLLFLVCAILGFFFKENFEAKLSQHMKSSLTDQFYVNYTTDSSNKLATDIWNKLQKEFQCCGVSGGLKSSWSWCLYQRSKWFHNQDAPALSRDYVPESCCNVSITNLTECQKLQPSAGSLIIPVQKEPSMVTDVNPALYHRGCYDAVRESISQNTITIASIVLVCIVITVLCIMLATCVCMEIRQYNYIV
ncbi:tetraspanin-9-like isoform X1 [Biomphalaria glabrata]|uniref:Tetraspanin n=1 Tax=Biomphalaria glabrata TaxID=6526 RepID=A0A9W3AFX7_BIOGL|nr:tetraspanin-9-like isoform X1 [Biomphalaria glabrata]XP_055886103.1 tetraspanin-9-like isoform X1 [Biomphalaria glabrata]KAI8749925.1 tetraspanin-9-like isoform X1 [Biomphalaria glabrata]KAI8787209.1 tetraspanin-9 isoform X1 [Biomphalaria glabrata]